MLTKTELIEKAKAREAEITEAFKDARYKGFDKLKESFRWQGIGMCEIISMIEQLPDTTELQAENEVLKLALKNAVRSKLYYEIGNIGISENSSLWSDLPYKIEENISLFIDQAKQQILEGKR